MSPYSYLAWCWLRENKNWVEDNWGPVHLKPVLMARVIKAHDTKGPAEIDPKREYLLRECLRIAKIENLPFKCPGQLPFNNLSVARLGCYENDQFKLVDEIFRLGWEKGISLDADNEEMIISELSSAGFNEDQLKTFLEDKKSRVVMKNNCKEAITKKLFGVPSFLLIEDELEELFWGRESIPHLKLKIMNNDPLDQEAYCDFLDKIQV